MVAGQVARTCCRLLVGLSCGGNELPPPSMRPLASSRGYGIRAISLAPAVSLLPGPSRDPMMEEECCPLPGLSARSTRPPRAISCCEVPRARPSLWIRNGTYLERGALLVDTERDVTREGHPVVDGLCILTLGVPRSRETAPP